jgi:membrane protease YdiL (CAAX protease family)
MVLLLIAASAALPFMQALQALSEDKTSSHALVLLFGQMLLEGAAGLALGLSLGRPTGLGFALIPRWLDGEPAGRQSLHIVQLALVVAIVGTVGAIAIGTAVLLLALVFGMDPATLQDAGALTVSESYPAPWRWLLISLNAGIAEEIVFRLGLLTAFAWLGSLLWRDEHGRPTQAVFWGANLVAGLSFGVAHLYGGMPYPEIPVIMARIVIQNTMLGLVLGWLYRRWGLESAMLAHFCLDVVLYVVLIPSLQSQNVVCVVTALASLVVALAWAWRGLRKRAPGGRPTEFLNAEQ